MKHGNLFAASLTAATFVVLALLPLTKEALRFDMQIAAGKPVLGRTLTDLGIRQDALPLGGIGPKFTASRDDAALTSSEFSVQLANAMLLPGREKWAALQKLGEVYPDNPAGHAALVRMACKNGGSVGVGHEEEQALLYSKPTQIHKSVSQPDANDPLIMLRSCRAGEQLAPDNAYFPAMAAIAHLALNEDGAAHAALYRAAEKPYWNEYFAVEAEGRVRRAELLNGSQNSLTRSAAMASMLFPHYAALRGMARVVTAQAMQQEQAGDIKAGLGLRRTVARLGAKMREQSSSLIGGLVGMAMIRVTELRPGGAPALEDDYQDGDAIRQKTDARFLAYLASHDEQSDVARWQQYLKAEAETKAIVQQGVYYSVFGTRTLFESQWKLLTNLALLGAVTLLSILGGLALLRPSLDGRLGRAAFILAITGFFALLAWATWQALGNFRDILAFGTIIQGLSNDGGNTALARAEFEALRQALYTEGTIGLMALLTPPLYLCILAYVARRHRVSFGSLLQRCTLPLAAFLTIVYALHLTVYAERERTVLAELQQVITHEGRYMAEKQGKVWPTTPD